MTILTNTKIKFIRYIGFALTLTAMITIFMFSSGNSKVSSSQSGKVTKAVIRVTHSNYNSLSEKKQTVIYNRTEHTVRKLAHFSIFAFLGFSVMTAAATYKTDSRSGGVRRLIFCAAFCIVYAVSDEFHQTFVSGRNGNITDVLIDFSGACVGMAAAWLIVLKFIIPRCEAGKKA